MDKDIKTKSKDNDQCQKEEIEIIFNIIKPPSELGISDLNKEWYRILKEMGIDGRLD
ncbi:MAG: hypothetical protein PHR25_06745 [Clostridia bacterium]|nr:hypothetical protein [Clostridia bacterium]